MRSLMKVAVLLAAFGVSVGGAGSLAAAQEGVFIGNVPFKFIASGKAYDAGAYDMSILNEGLTVELRGPANTGGFAPVISRLSTPETAVSGPYLVFDKVGDTYFLSEMWLPGQDGFLFYAAKEKHTHQTLKLRRGGKGR